MQMLCVNYASIKQKLLTIPCAGKDLDELDDSIIAGGNV
jgi:hypothetical protein